MAKDILSDGVITEEEYRAAEAEYVSCMNDNGLPVYSVEYGRLFQYGFPGTGDDEADWARMDEADAVCRPRTIQDVEWLFAELVENPDKIIKPLRQVECLRKKGLPGGEMDWREFQEAMQAFADSGVVGEIDFNDPEVIECVVSPERA